MEVSRELFFRHGLKSITMDDIAQQLGMSKRPFTSIIPIRMH